MAETNNRFAPESILNKQKEQQETIHSSHVENGAVGRMQNTRNRASVSPEEMARREKEANTKKLKYALANKDIYEFTDEEKQLYIESHPEEFVHNEDDVSDCEFLTSSSVAELVLSDYFVKKERTKGMNFLFNFHTDAADGVLDE